MFTKANRLTKTKDIDRTFKQGRGCYGDFLGIKTIDNNLEKNRLTVVVGLKVSKKAVERNKLKRQIRAVLKQEMPKMITGKDIIVLCLPNVVEKTYKEMENSLKEILSRLKFYK